jgi:hypothetical protein
MKRLTVLCLMTATGILHAEGEWSRADWKGELAFASTSQTWKAVVSSERGRLVYLGPNDGSTNLLFETSGRDDANGWGGQRVWLGPQTKWGHGGWPAPPAWEKSAAERANAEGNRLVLTTPDAGDGWPHLQREYAWHDGRLHCTVRIEGGTRPAQVIQIFQVPALSAVTVAAEHHADVPHGYVLLHLGRPSSPIRNFAPRPQVTLREATLQIRFNGTPEKIGVQSQPLFAAQGNYRLSVSRGESAGPVESVPDDGYLTQIYLGRQSEPFIELEQLSPAWRPGGDASFDVILEPTRVALANHQ